MKKLCTLLLITTSLSAMEIIENTLSQSVETKKENARKNQQYIELKNQCIESSQSPESIYARTIFARQTMDKALEESNSESNSFFSSTPWYIPAIFSFDMVNAIASKSMEETDQDATDMVNKAVRKTESYTQLKSFLELTDRKCELLEPIKRRLLDDLNSSTKFLTQESWIVHARFLIDHKNYLN